MSFEVPQLSIAEAREILTAVDSVLSYAKGQTAKRRHISGNIVKLLERGALSVRTGGVKDLSMSGLVAQCRIATGHIREAYRLTQETADGTPSVRRLSKALIRALDLLSPLTKKEGPYHLPLRRQRVLSRRLPPVLYGGRRTKVIDVDIPGDFGSCFFTGFDQNHIDSGGLFIATYDAKPVGTSLAVRIRMPDQSIIIATASVKWIREFSELTRDFSPGMGIVFTNLNNESQKEINQYLTSNESIFFEAS